ncbi:hypothetical protein BH09PLA1_BH09PLA1_28620 [soil metagenome]
MAWANMNRGTKLVVCAAVLGAGTMLGSFAFAAPVAGPVRPTVAFDPFNPTRLELVIVSGPINPIYPNDTPIGPNRPPARDPFRPPTRSPFAP